jgi:hypothetical protein
MPWERGNYYRCVRVNGKPRRQYVGRGEVGRLAETIDRIMRLEREIVASERAARLASIDRLARPPAAQERLHEAAATVARTALLLAGFRQHKRGEQRRAMAKNVPAELTTNLSNTPIVLPPDLDAGEVLAALRECLGGGGKQHVALIRKLLAHNPANALGMCGEPARVAQQRLIQVYADDNVLLAEAARHRLEALRRDLLGPAPTAIERLLVEAVVTADLHHHTLESVYAGKLAAGGMTLEVSLHFQRCLCLSQKRLNAAARNLAQVRRLALPVLLEVLDRPRLAACDAVPRAGRGESR